MSGLVKPSLDYGTVLEDVRGPELRELIAGLKFVVKPCFELIAQERGRGFLQSWSGR